MLTSEEKTLIITRLRRIFNYRDFYTDDQSNHLLVIDGLAFSGKTSYVSAVLAHIVALGETDFECIRIVLHPGMKDSLLSNVYDYFRVLPGCDMVDRATFDEQLSNITHVESGDIVELNVDEVYPDTEYSTVNVDKGFTLKMVDMVGYRLSDNIVNHYGCDDPGVTMMTNMPVIDDLDVLDLHTSDPDGSLFDLEDGVWSRNIVRSAKDACGRRRPMVKLMERAGSMRPNISSEPVLLPLRNGD